MAGDEKRPDPATLMIAEHLNSLGTLVAGVAHEINNPITYVLGNLKELERLCTAMRGSLSSYRDALGKLGPDASALIEDVEGKLEAAGGVDLLDELLDDANEGAVRIRDLVRDLLALSRGAERTTAPVAVGDVLDSTLRLVSRPLSGCATLVKEYEARRLIDGDRAKLGQVFLNLVNNAIDACRGGTPETHRVIVRIRDAGLGVRIEFEDTGSGIPEEHRGRVFAPFYTTKDPGDGTGLGLYISQRIIEEHGGKIGVSAGASGGTLVWVELPEA